VRTMVYCHATPDRRRPDWRRISRDGSDNDMVAVTRGTLRAAEAALKSYGVANYQPAIMAAEAEVMDALREAGS
jgi:hypothetical protein